MFYILLLLNTVLVESMDPALQDLLTPLKKIGEFCGYESCPQIYEGKINVHIVPHTHAELGYTGTFDQHYSGEDPIYPKSNINMKRILDYVISELWSHDDRKFTIGDMPYFFHWWFQRDDTVHRMVYELIRQGRLHFVGGGWGMPDEACTNYQAIIDTFTYTLRKINATFLDCGRPLVAWQSDVLGHSREFASLMAQMGFDGHFISPISFDDELERMSKKAMEFLWRGSDDLGRETDIYTHKLFDGYWSPPGFCFGALCKDPLLITSDTVLSNVDERVELFIDSVRRRQAPSYTTDNIMVIMGRRFAYHDAAVWFANIDKLINRVNEKSFQDGSKVRLFYSTPACYLKAVHDARPLLQTKQDDFFPYAHDKLSYATGSYTSRPSFKVLAKEGNIYLQIIKQLQVLARLGEHKTVFQDLNWMMGVIQDHYIITGLMRNVVREYYVHKMYMAIQKSTIVVRDGFNKLRKSSNSTMYYRCSFNTSSCRNTNGPRSFVVIYNPLAWTVSLPVRLPVRKFDYEVLDPDGFEVESSIMPLPKQINDLPFRNTTADHELIFIAQDLPPLGFRSYYIEVRNILHSRTKRYSKNVSLRNKSKKIIKKDQTHNIIDDFEDDELINEIKRRFILNVKTKKKFEDMIDFVNKSNKIIHANKTKKYIKNFNKIKRKKKFNFSENNNKPKKSRTISNKAETVFEDGEDYYDDRRETFPKLIIGNKTKYIDAYKVIPILPTQTTENLQAIETDYSDEDIENLTPKVIVNGTGEITNIIFNRTDSIGDSETEFEDEEKQSEKELTKLRTITQTTTDAKNITTEVVSSTPEAESTLEPIRRYKGTEQYVDGNENVSLINAIETSTEFVETVPQIKEPIEQTSPMISVLNEIVEMETLPNNVESIEEVNNQKTKIILQEKVPEIKISDDLDHNTYDSIGARRNYESVTLKPHLETSTYIQTVNATDNFKDDKVANTQKETRYFEKVNEIDINKEAMAQYPDYKHDDIETTTASKFEIATSDAIQKTQLSKAVTEGDANKATDARKNDYLYYELQTTIPNKFKLNLKPSTESSIANKMDITDKIASIEDFPVRTKAPTLTEKVSLKGLFNEVKTTDSNKATFYSKKIVKTEETSKKTFGNVNLFEYDQATENFSVIPKTTIAVDWRTTEQNIRESTIKETIENTMGRIDNVIEVESTTYSRTPKVTTEENILVTTNKEIKQTETGEFPEFDRRRKYFYEESDDLFIKNKYVRVNIDPTTNKISSINMSNNINLQLDIQFYYYLSDQPHKTGRIREIDPGPFIFKPLDEKPEAIIDFVVTKVLKTDLVQEIHCSYADYASFNLRLYKLSRVLEVDWVIGPIPVEDGLGKEVFIRYMTDLKTDSTFYTDANGRQTIKRIRDRRASFVPSNKIAGNYYPVTSKITIEDIKKNIRFTVFPDRTQGGTSLYDGEVDLMINRRILTDERGIQATLDETENDQGIVVRGKHYIYISKAKPYMNKVIEKKFAKEIQLQPQIFVSKRNVYKDDTKKIWLKQYNQFSGSTNGLPLGVHLLTLERFDDKILIRLENYLEKDDFPLIGAKIVNLKDFFADIKILEIKEMTLAGNMELKDWVPLHWYRKDEFYKSFNNHYGTNDDELSVSDELNPIEEVDLNVGIILNPQQIKTFAIKFKYIT